VLIYNRPTYLEQLSEYLLLKVGLITIIVLSFYTYLKAIFPLLPFLKDALIIISSFVVFLSIIASGGKISKPNYLDNIIFILLLYLLFQIIHTFYLTKNIFVTYYGFRLSFMYILLYFLFRTISHPNYKRIIDSIIISTLAIGCFLTIIEFFLISTGIISLDYLLWILQKEDIKGFLGGFAFGGFAWSRVVGIAGTPHMTGVFNVIFFGLLLFSINTPLNKIYSSQSKLFIKYIKPKLRKYLLFISFLAVILSSSKTAWTILFIIILIFPFYDRAISFKRIMVSLSIVFCSVGILYSYMTTLLDSSYIGFLGSYLIHIQFFMADVLNNSPLIGYGFEVGAYSKYLDISNVRAENITTTAEFFPIQLFRMHGFIGILLYLGLFLIFPSYIIFSKHQDKNVKMLAIPILVVGIAFGHYNPLENTVLEVCVWYYFAAISNEISLNNQKSKQFNYVNISGLKY